MSGPSPSPQSAFDEIDAQPALLFHERADLLSKRDMAALLQRFRSQWRKAEASGSVRDNAWSILKIAMVLNAQRDFASALEWLDKAKNAFVACGDGAGHAACLGELSYASRELDRNALSLEYAHAAIDLLQKHDRQAELGWMYDLVSGIYANLFQRHESLIYAKKARTAFVEHGLRNQLAWNACNLATIYYDMGFQQEAAQYASEAIQLFARLENKNGTAWSLFRLGIIYRAQGRFKEAEKLIAQAKEAFRVIGLKDRVGWCMLNEAAMARSMGDAKQALKVNRQAVQIFSPIRNHDGVAWSYFQIGRVHRDMGVYIKAWQTFRDALNLHTDISNQKGMMWSQNEWGCVYAEMNDLAHARECFVKAKVIADRLDESPLKAEVNKNLAMLCLDEGLLQKAASLLDQADQICQKVKERELEADILLARVRLSIATGEMGHAATYADQVAGLINGYGLFRLTPVLLVYRAEIEALGGRPGPALQLFRKAHQAADKAGQKRVRVEALLGAAQLSGAKGAAASVLPTLAAVERDIRSLGSRKLRAKSSLVKGLLHRQSGHVDARLFLQGVNILNAAGLAVLERQALGLVIEVFSQASLEREKSEATAAMVRLMEKGLSDLGSVTIRTPDLAALPVSLAI